MTAPPPPRQRIGLGTMRLTPESAPATIAAAVQAGITVFDTARAYGTEALVAQALRATGAAPHARIVTKGGMRRPDGAWVPDGRARSLRADCEASLAALDGLPIDLYLIHAPDPRTPWPTTVRALARLREEGLVARIGVSNVTRDQLEAAVALAPIAAVSAALSLADDRALRGGLVARCEELGLQLIAHAPLGGPRRAPSLARRADLAAIADAHGATAAEVALAWLLGLSPAIVPIPGAGRPDSVLGAARAGTLRLAPAQQAALTRERARRPTAARTGEVVLIMGIPGAGKTRLAATYTERGYVRLNRDERGGRLAGLAEALDAELAAGRARVVLDNTYLTRAQRAEVLDTAHRHGVAVRCLWLEVTLAQAQVNLVARLLDLHDGTLPGPEQLRGRIAGVMAPTSQMRTLRELETPEVGEGFAAVEVVPFARRPGTGAPGVFAAAAALETDAGAATVAGATPNAAHLVFDWRPGAPADALAPALHRLASLVSGPVAAGLCPHPGGPPRCWCRPPLPGLVLAFARAHDIEPSRSILVGTSTAHRTLAAALGARYVAAVA